MIDVPFPDAGVHALLGQVEPLVGALEVPFEAERVRQRLFETMAEQADDHRDPGEHGEVQDVGHVLHGERSARLEEREHADEHGERRRDQPGAEPPDDGRRQHGQRERKEDGLVLQPGIECAARDGDEEGRRDCHGIARGPGHGDAVEERDSHLGVCVAPSVPDRVAASGHLFAREHLQWLHSAK